jgi:D-alanyl-D-alanine carboxypeptidase
MFKPKAETRLRSGAPCIAKALVALAAALLLILPAAGANARTHHAHAKPAHATPKRHFFSLLGPDPKYASLVIDADNGVVLHEADPDKIVHPASLTKMMTLLVVFEALREGRVTLNDRVPVSAFAHSMAPSKLDVPVGSTIRLQDAIYAVVTHSANDMAVALGEYIGGSQAGFTAIMDQRAQSLGMSNSHFVNACGLPDPRQVTSARDMARLAHALIYYYPQYYHYFSTPSFVYAGHVYANHNHLMETYPGMDGIKTGYIVASGFNLVASAKRGNHRLIGVIFGGQSAHARDLQMASLLDAGFAIVQDPGYTTRGMPVISEQARPAPSSSVGMAATSSEGRPRQLAINVLNPAGARSSAVALPQAVSPASGIAPALAPARSSLPGYGWSAQIGAYADQARASQALLAAMAALPPGLRHVTPVVVPLRTAQGWMYRGWLSGLTQAEAAIACGHILNCLPVGPDAR